MKRGRNPITLQAIRDVLKRLIFNPNEPGTMSIIADNTDPKYWELRAAEQIREIHMFNLVGEEAQARLELAAKLLALSLAERKRCEQAVTKTQ